jgi:hypothetical protein
MPDPKALIFIQTVLANFYPKLAPCIRPENLGYGNFGNSPNQRIAEIS